MRTTTAHALLAPGAPLQQITLDRRDLRPDDLAVRVDFCGVCHSDLHALEQARPGQLPLVPGHEFVGEVVAVGPAVTGFSVGDPVAVGNIVDSCGTCENCLADEQSLCVEFPTLTYGGRDRHDGSRTQGAWSGEYVVRESFAYHLPAGLDPAAVAPLMCAGVTTWAPLARAGVGPGDRVGVVGLGGLGHLAVKFAVARGAEVSVFTTSPRKRADALALGAVEVVVSTDPAAMAAAARRFDLVVDTASGDHDPSPYLETLRRGGTLCMLGIPPRYSVSAMSLLPHRSLTASGSAGRADTQAMLDFAAEHGVVADVEVLPAARLAEALERLARNDVRHRFVLDLRPGADPQAAAAASPARSSAADSGGTGAPGDREGGRTL
jgi:uncharacterized zinc-type alcohol dehydrogenase-like protein